MGSTADALFSTTQQRVLRLFFAEPERSYIQQEVIEATGSGSGAVQRELARLLESGILTVTVLGRQKLYQANRASAIFEELRAIVDKIMIERRTRVVRVRKPPGPRIEERKETREETREEAREEAPSSGSGWQLIFD